MSEKGCNHCWHGTGNVYLTYPPMWQEVCCYCGEERVQSGVNFADSKKHGPHLPAMSRAMPLDFMGDDK